MPAAVWDLSNVEQNNQTSCLIKSDIGRSNADSTKIASVGGQDDLNGSVQGVTVCASGGVFLLVKLRSQMHPV